MKRLNIFSGIFIATVLIFVQTNVWATGGQKPMVQKNCLNCHQSFNDMENILAGNLSSKSMKANTIQIKINDRLELLKFGLNLGELAISVPTPVAIGVLEAISI
jgi:hypothetical protein